MDKKGRIVLPARGRKQMGEKVIIAQGFEECLVIYQRESFEKLEELLVEVFNSAQEIKIDNQGRIRISPQLREFASLKKGKIIILGVGTHLEIWNPNLLKEIRK